MKKLALSIALMSLVVIGGSAVTFASETNEDVNTTEVTTTTEESTPLGNPECPYYGENDRGVGNPECPYYGEGNRGVGNPECPYYEENQNKENKGSENANRLRKHMGSEGNRQCDGTRSRMMNGRNK